MVNINQITIQIQMFISSHLYRRIRRFLSACARWESHFCEESERWEGDAGDGLGGEFVGVCEEDFLDLGVRGLRPGGC